MNKHLGFTRRIGIRGRIAIFVVIAALPLFLLAAYRAKQEWATAFERARESALLVARAQATRQAAQLEDVRRILSSVAALRGASDAEDQCPALARAAEASSLGFVLGAADSRGYLRCPPSLSDPIDVSDRDYFRQALAHHRATVSSLLTGRVRRLDAIAIAQPIFDSTGSTAEMLIASIAADRLVAGFDRSRLPEGAVVALVDSGSRIVARLPDVPGFRGKVVPDLAKRAPALAAEREGILDTVGLDGVERIGAFARLPEAWASSLYVVVGIPHAAVENGPRAAFLRELAVLLLVLSIALAISFVGAQRLLVTPLRRLSNVAQRYDRGETSARSGIDHSAGEIGALAHSFDRLADHNARVTRALKALSAGNRTLLRETKEPQLLAAMCKVAVDHAGYRLALVNYVEHDEEKTVRSMARAGHDDGFVDSLNLTWEDSERGRGSVGTAIRTRRTCVIKSLANDPRFAPWREAAIARGFGSIASFPLLVDDVVIGTFSIIAAEEDAFDTDELELLDEMAADLSFGIQTLRSNAQRLRTDEAHRRAITHDKLTGLPGRVPFLQAVEAARHEAVAGGSFTVSVVTLQNLRELHDSLGYDPANAAVLEVATKLKFAMTPAKALARTAEDEFALLVPRADAMASAELARRLHALFSIPISVSGVLIDLRCHIGNALYPVHGDDPEMLLRRATIAAREAQQAGVGFALYRGGSERENPARLQIAADLRQAIAQRTLTLHYQAKYDLKAGAVSGAEALVRWPHPQKGMVPPAEFIPVAEQTGLIAPLTSLVVESAVRQLSAWRDLPAVPRVAVNLSPRNLHDPRLLEELEYVLGAWNVPATNIEFEITESALAQEPEKARLVLERLRALGSKLYIDDFGTGYSSLSYLVSLPVHALKIDRSFVRQMSKSREARAVVSSIIGMAQQLGLSTVAEGVETADEVELLKQLGCDHAQGYFFARPVPPEQFFQKR